MLNVISKLEISTATINRWMSNATAHAHVRRNRFALVDTNGLKSHKAFVVDKGHQNGFEIHVVTFNAEILIFNLETKKAITVLFARPRQIERYYEQFEMTVPHDIIEKAIENVRTGKNNI